MGGKKVEQKEKSQGLMFQLRALHSGYEVRLAILITIRVLDGMKQETINQFIREFSLSAVPI
jgi:hypothetical protein